MKLAAGRSIGAIRVPVTPLAGGVPREVVETGVIAPLREAHPEVELEIELDRTQAVDYYTGACFHIYAEDPDGRSLQLVDGGFTTWTQELANSRKERLMISGIGTESVVSLFG